MNLGINRLELVSMEPMPRKEAVSKNYSFSTTRFYDEHNLVAPAWHERTLAVIRTSESSGYYVDVFRAKSDVENQFHDYIYRNIGETLEFSGVTLGDDDGRFAGPAEMPWKSNQLYRHPGWHFFKNVKVSGVLDTPVKAVFEASKLAANTVGMTVFLNGTSNRSYASAMSPPATLNTSDYYKKKDIPTLVVRKEGEAWNQPFAAIYEPFSKKASNGSVQSVETLEEAGVFKGFVVKSTIAGQRLTQLVLIQESGQVYENADWKLRFVGHFAVVTIDAKGSTRALYIGDGASLVVGDEELTPAAESKSAFVSF